MARKQATKIEVIDPPMTENDLTEDDLKSLDPDGPGAQIGSFSGPTEEDEHKIAYAHQEPKDTVEQQDSTEVYVNPNPRQLITYPTQEECGRWIDSNMLEAFEENNLFTVHTITGNLIGTGHSLQEACYAAGLRKQNQDDDTEEP